MVKTFAVVLVTMLLASMLAACGGDGDATPTQTAAPAALATATATEAAATVEPTATATEAATATAPASPSPLQTRAPSPAPTRLIATPTPTPVPPTPTPEASAGAEALIGYAALTVEDLSPEWVLDSTEVPELSSDDSTAICGQPRFAERDQRVAALQLEFSNDGLPAALTQDLHVFPIDIAYTAMEYARGIAGSCTEWTDDEGITFQVSPLEDPLLGDESFAILLSFNTPEGQAIDAYMTFVREDEYLFSLTYVTLAGGDTSPLLGIMQTATAKVFGVSESFFYEQYDPELLALSGALLLTGPELPGAWSLSEYVIPSGEERYGICGGGSFPDEFGALSEIGVRFEGDPDSGPFVAHNIVVFEDEDVANDALAFIFDTTTCESWTDDDGAEYVVVNRPSYALVEESVAVIVEGQDEEVGTVQLGFVFVRTAGVITAILYAQMGEIDPVAMESIAQAAVAKLGR